MFLRFTTLLDCRHLLRSFADRISFLKRIRTCVRRQQALEAALASARWRVWHKIQQSDAYRAILSQSCSKNAGYENLCKPLPKPGIP